MMKIVVKIRRSFLWICFISNYDAYVEAQKRMIRKKLGISDEKAKEKTNQVLTYYQHYYDCRRRY